MFSQNKRNINTCRPYYGFNDLTLRTFYVESKLKFGSPIATFYVESMLNSVIYFHLFLCIVYFCFFK